MAVQSSSLVKNALPAVFWFAWSSLALIALMAEVACARNQPGNAAEARSAGTAAAATEASKAAEKLYIDAVIAEIALGDTRSVATYDLGNDNRRTVVRWVKVIDHMPRERLETTLSSPTSPPITFVVISSPEGRWDLYPDAGIRRVDRLSELHDLVAESTNQVPREASSFSAAPRMVGGRRYMGVTAHFSEDTRLALATHIRRLLPGQGTTPAAILASIPIRREYLIDEDLHIVTSLRNINASGAVIQETHIDQIEAHLNLPADLFTVPSGIPRYYPQTTEEYRSLSMDALIRSRTTISPGTTPGKNHDSKNQKPKIP